MCGAKLCGHHRHEVGGVIVRDGEAGADSIDACPAHGESKDCRRYI